jgi:hypothetical protein
MSPSLTGYTPADLLNQIARSLNLKIAVGYEQLIVAGTAIGFASIPLIATLALIIIESTVAAPATVIRFREDGPAPTGSIGMPMGVGAAFEIISTQDMMAFLAIQTQAGIHKLNVTYYK